MTAATPGAPRPVALCILDGFGYREEQADNAVAQAETPHFDRLWAEAPHGLLQACGEAVGLPEGQMGNSEVGHLNLGAGRVVLQELVKIDKTIREGSLGETPGLREVIDKTARSGGAVHLMGLLSPGGVHAHQRHIAALARALDEAGLAVRIHAFTDGRDTPPKGGLDYLRHFQEAIADLSDTRIVTVDGRYYAMDRDRRWERIQKAYDAMVLGQGPTFATAQAVLEDAYARDIGDEFVPPAVIEGYAGMADGDSLVAANFRSDRMRQILEALVDPDFDGFQRQRPVRFAAKAGMVDYSDHLKSFMTALFPPKDLPNLLGEVVARAGLKQLRIAETEKYPHVTFFFNGGPDVQYEGEDRVLVPSPKVATYDLQPEMSAPEVTERLVEGIESGAYDLVVVNFANPDMVGHTGSLSAAIKACEAADTGLGALDAALRRQGGAMIVLADHGNADIMRDPETGQPHTAHTLNPVPCIIAGAPGDVTGVREGRLGDVAPTLLALMGREIPAEMTGTSLMVHSHDR